MSLKAPTIVILDMDGTTVRHVNPRILSVLEFFDDLSYRANRFYGWIFRRGGHGPIIPESERGKSMKPPRLLVHRALHKVRRKSVEQIVQPCPGVFEVLKLLRERSIPVALVSNGLGKGYGHEIMDTFNLEPCFQAAVFREDIRQRKPHPEALLLAVERLGLKPHKNDVIWFIGDRHKDITAALALRQHTDATVVPIAYGLNAAIAALEKGVGPDHIIMSWYDMHDKLEDLLNEIAAKEKSSHVIPREGGESPSKSKRSSAFAEDDSDNYFNRSGS